MSNLPLELPGANPLKDAHAALAAALNTAYGFNARRQRESELKIAESPIFLRTLKQPPN